MCTFFRRSTVVLFAWVVPRLAVFEGGAAAANEREDLLMLLIEGARDNRDRIQSWEWVHEVDYRNRGPGKRVYNATVRYHSVSDGVDIWGTGRPRYQAELRRPDLYATRSEPHRGHDDDRVTVQAGPVSPRTAPFGDSHDIRQRLSDFASFAVKPENKAVSDFRWGVAWGRLNDVKMLRATRGWKVTAPGVRYTMEVTVWVDPARGYAEVRRESVCRMLSRSYLHNVSTETRELARYGDVWFPRVIHIANRPYGRRKVNRDDTDTTLSLKINGAVDSSLFTLEGGMKLRPGTAIVDERTGAWHDVGKTGADEPLLVSQMTHPLVEEAFEAMNLVKPKLPDRVVSTADEVTRWYSERHCGANCLYLAILMMSHVPVSLPELRQHFPPSKHEYLPTMTQLLNAAEGRALQAGLKEVAWDELRRHRGLVLAKSLLLRDRVVVLLPFYEKDMLLLDPPEEPRVISADELSKHRLGNEVLVFRPGESKVTEHRP